MAQDSNFLNLVPHGEFRAKHIANAIDAENRLVPLEDKTQNQTASPTDTTFQQNILLPEGKKFGIGTSTPDSALHIKSLDDAVLHLEADSDNVGESGTPYIKASADGGTTSFNMGITGVSQQDPEGNTVNDASSNDFIIHANTADGIQFAVAGQVYMEITGDYTRIMGSGAFDSLGELRIGDSNLINFKEKVDDSLELDVNFGDFTINANNFIVTNPSVIDGRNIGADGATLDALAAKYDAENWDATKSYTADQDMVWFTGTLYRCIVNTSPGESPTTTPASWDQVTLTAGEVKTQYESNADTNAFTDADKTKLGTLSVAMTDAEVKTAYENNANTNEFDDAEQSKLASLNTQAVSVLSWGATVAVDASLGNVFTGTNTVAGLIQAPTNPSAGQEIEIQITASATAGAVTFDSVFDFQGQVPSASTTLNAIDVVRAKYNGTKWISQFFNDITSDEITVTSAGDVGIGIVTPTEKLDVVGNVKATAFIGDGSGLTGISTGPDDHDGAGSNSTTIGTGATSFGVDSTSVGDLAAAGNVSCTAVGKSALATGPLSTVVGKGSNSTGNSGVILGSGSTVNGANGVAIGNSIVVGTDEVRITDRLFIDGNNIHRDMGGRALKVRSLTAAGTYSLGAEGFILCNTSAGNFTLDLPTAVSVAGRVYDIKKDSDVTNTVTLNPSGVEEIDGATSAVLSNAWAHTKIISNGSNWNFIK